MNKLATLFLLFSIFSCNSNKHFYILFDRVDGLNEGTMVYLDNIEIGEVVEISLNSEFNALVKCRYGIKNVIPKNSVIKIDYNDILGISSIEIISGSSGILINEGDTLIGTFVNDSKIDSIVSKGTKIINKVIDKSNEKVDSLSNEVNERIEKIKSKY